MTDDIVFERTGSLAEIVLNRPKALNALTLEMVDRMDAQLQQWAEDTGVGCVVIRPAPGGRAFAAGGDIERLYRERGQPYTATFFWNEYILNWRIHHYAKPYVAFMDGIVMGGGVGVSVLGSVRVATENTTFAMPETGIGFFPDVGGGWFLPRLPGRLGVYHAMTGGRLHGADFCAVGLADVYIPSERLDDAAEILATLDPPCGRGQVMGVLGVFAEKPPAAKITGLQPMIDRLFAGGTVEEIFSALFADPSEDAQKWAKAMAGKAPTSLKVALEQLRRGKAMTLDQVLAMEFRLAQPSSNDHDFFEGIRALIGHKDNRPDWQPSTHAGVTAERVGSYFLPAAAGELCFDPPEPRAGLGT
jgi:enoyl-CoA hydratase